MPVLDCTDHRGGAPARNSKLVRISDGKKLFGFFRKLGRGKVRVIACHRGRLHIIPEVIEEDVAQKIMILKLIELDRESAHEAD